MNIKKLSIFFLIVGMPYIHCGDNLALVVSNETNNSNFETPLSASKDSLIFETSIKFYNFLFRKQYFTNTDVRNKPKENSLTTIFKIDENKEKKNSLISYLDYFCSNPSIFKYHKETKKFNIKHTP